MAAPVIAATTAYGAVASTHTVTLPLGTVSGDLLVAHGVTWGGTLGATLQDEAGWTTVEHQGHSSDGDAIVWAKIYAGEGNPTFDTNASVNTAIRLMRITGAAALIAEAINVSLSAESNLQNPVAPAVTTTVADCLVLYAILDTWGESDTKTIPAGTASVGNADQGDAAYNIAQKDQASAGSSGTGTFTGVSGNNEFAAITIAIAPPVAADPTLTADQGSYTLTGQAATLSRQVRLTAEQGSYALTGQDADTAPAFKIAADQGSYVLTGQDAATRKGSTLLAGQGAYLLTGQDVTFIAPAPPVVVPEAVGGGGGAPRFRPDTEREERHRRDDRHLRRTVEIAATGRVVSPDLMLDESEQAEQDKALAVVLIGLLQ